MPEVKFLKCACVHCGGHIEFPADGIGTSVSCPHCGSETDLVLDVPAIESGSSSRSRKWLIAGIIIILVGVVGVLGALQAARTLSARARARVENKTTVGISSPNAAAAPGSEGAQLINQFAVSKVTIEKKPGSAILYAVGTVRNETDRQRFGVTVEVDLLDSADTKVGVTKDYRAVAEPRAEWTFRALLIPGNVASARVTSVREE